MTGRCPHRLRRDRGRGGGRSGEAVHHPGMQQDGSVTEGGGRNALGGQSICLHEERLALVNRLTPSSRDSRRR